MNSSYFNYYKKNSESSRIITNLLHQLPETSYLNLFCHPSIQNPGPFLELGYKISLRYTYQLGNMDQIKDLKHEFSPGLRQRISKLKKNYTLDYSNNPNKLFKIIDGLIKNKKANINFDSEYLANLSQSCIEHESGEYIFLRKGEELLAGAFLVYNKDTCYLLVSGSNEQARSEGFMSSLIYESILHASKKASIFDFTGSMLPGVERMIRSFNPIQIPYFQIYKAVGVLKFFRPYSSNS